MPPAVENHVRPELQDLINRVVRLVRIHLKLGMKFPDSYWTEDVQGNFPEVQWNSDESKLFKAAEAAAEEIERSRGLETPKRNLFSPDDAYLGLCDWRIADRIFRLGKRVAKIEKDVQAHPCLRLSRVI